MDAIFLDRDGVINADRPDYVRSWGQLRILPGALEALRRLRVAGVPVFVVTNQSAVGRGLMDLAALEEIHWRLRRVVWRAGGEIRDIFYCPHRPEDGCPCRKPKAGLLLQAAERYGLDLRRCALVGDARTDVQAARAAGCQAILVQTGRGRDEHRAALAAGLGGYRLARDLAEAVDLLLADGPVAPPPLIALPDVSPPLVPSP